MKTDRDKLIDFKNWVESKFKTMGFELNLDVDVYLKENSINPIPLTEEQLPSPYKWIKEKKFEIPEGATYREPIVRLSQCASWITEYINTFIKK